MKKIIDSQINGNMRTLEATRKTSTSV